MQFSIVTPTYQRAPVIRRSIDSSLAFARSTGNAEIVIVDDGSSDGTVAMLRAAYPDEIANGTIVLLERPANGGVTAAKNDGGRAARGDWLIFIDSDDELLPAAADVLPAFLSAHANAALCFFRCEDEAGRLIGRPQAAGPLDLVTLLTDSTPGECMPVVARTAFLANPYDEDLRGFEGIAFWRIVRDFGPAILSERPLRRYGTAGADRLSANNLRRAGLLARGNMRMLREFSRYMPWRQRLATGLRVLIYGLLAPLSRGR